MFLGGARRGRASVGDIPKCWHSRPVDSAGTDRNLHIVVPSIGRPTCAHVVSEALGREARLARLTVVSQGCPALVTPELRAEAARRDIVLGEVVLPDAVGPAQARHLGALEGDEDFVGFLDDDITFEQGTLSSLVDGCERHDLGGACGVLVVPEAAPLARLVKGLLFWSIFRDRRQWAAWSRRPVRSAVLSGGMTVFRRALYLRCAASWTSFVPHGYGEDVELSFAISRLAPLVVDPALRVDNTQRQQSTGPAEPTSRALQHLDRYRAFADRHAHTRRHWLAYGVVLVGVLARGVNDGARLPFVRAVAAEGRRAAQRALAPAARAALRWSVGEPLAPNPKPANEKATVGAVVVHYRSETTLEPCLRALATQTRPPDQIAVVANSPLPPSGAAAALDVTVLQNPSNVGFAAACNQAAEALDVDYLWFVNPDVRCEATCLERLLAYASDTAVVAPVLVRTDRQPELSTKTRRYVTPWVLLARELGFGRRLRLGSGHPLATPAVVTAVSGACLLAPTKPFSAVGGFDERYFLYGEDVDLCLRLAPRGVQIGVVTNATAVHASGTGAGGDAPDDEVRRIKGREARRAHALLLERFRSQRAARRYRFGLRLILPARLAVGGRPEDLAAYEWLRGGQQGAHGPVERHLAP